LSPEQKIAELQQLVDQRGLERDELMVKLEAHEEYQVGRGSFADSN
jgi:hypothetical protein